MLQSLSFFERESVAHGNFFVTKLIVFLTRIDCSWEYRHKVSTRWVEMQKQNTRFMVEIAQETAFFDRTLLHAEYLFWYAPIGLVVFVFVRGTSLDVFSTVGRDLTTACSLIHDAHDM